jgi:signal transduction histidine kinase/ActR/RegA family two-component response regulator
MSKRRFGEIGHGFRRGLAAAVVLGLAMLWLGVGFEIVQSQVAQRRQAELRMEAKADVLAEYTRTVLNNLDNALLAIRAQLPPDFQLSAALIEAHGKTLDGAIVHLSTMDAQGRVIFSTEPIIGQNLSDRPMFRSHQTRPEHDQLYIGIPSNGIEPGGRRLLHATRPLFQNGRFAGVVQAAINPALFEPLAKGLATRPGDLLALTHNQSGLQLVRYPSVPATETPTVIAGSPYLAPEAPPTGTFRRISPVDGLARVYAYRKLADFPVTVVAARDEPGPGHWLEGSRLWVLGMAALLTLGFIGLLMVLQRTIKRIDRDRAALAEARQRADAANREKSRFLAMMSHEIRTPLNGVVGMSQLMLGTSLSAEQRDYASNIAQSGQAVVAIVNDILDFSRIEAGRLELRPQPFSLQECIDVVIGMFRFEARSKGLILESLIDPSVQGNYLGDSLRIRQVLVNLIGNAIKFTERGRVTVRVSPACAQPEPQAPPGRVLTPPGETFRWLCIDVIDTGVGIPEAARAGLFRRFVQADSSSTRRYGGTGLGLAISKELLEAMGGTLSLLDNPPSGGSHFRMHLRLPLTQQLPVSMRVNAPGDAKRARAGEFGAALVPASQPLTPEAAPAPVAPAPVAPAAGGIAPGGAARAVESRGDLIPVLLAEDNIVNQKVASIMLNRLGYAVDLAENGQDAVQAAHKRRYGVILMDIRMPVMDGLAATRAIRASASQGGLNASTPIIAVTANALDEDRAMCMQAGMNDFLAKPLLMDHLDRCIRQWLPHD